MFAVLETVTVPSRRGWPRIGQRVAVRERDKPRYVSVTLEMPLSARDSDLRRRILRGLRAISGLGIAGVVLPKGFPFPELPGQYGLAVSSPVPLLRRLAAPLCRFMADQAGVPWGRVRLSLIGSRSTPEMLTAAQALAPAARMVHIQAGEDTAPFCYLLRSRCGVPAVGHPAKSAEGFWDILILFGLPPDDRAVTLPRHGAAPPFVLDLTGGNPALPGGRVADGALLDPPRSMWKDWPAGCDDAAMLAALLAAGQVSPADIGIRGLTRGGETVKLRS